jgi:hypothetical protein
VRSGAGVPIASLGLGFMASGLVSLLVRLVQNIALFYSALH